MMKRRTSQLRNRFPLAFGSRWRTLFVSGSPMAIAAPRGVRKQTYSFNGLTIHPSDSFEVVAAPVKSISTCYESYSLMR